jgi:hypothetical protein
VLYAVDSHDWGENQNARWQMETLLSSKETLQKMAEKEVLQTLVLMRGDRSKGMLENLPQPFAGLLEWIWMPFSQNKPFLPSY